MKNKKTLLLIIVSVILLSFASMHVMSSCSKNSQPVFDDNISYCHLRDKRYNSTGVCMRDGILMYNEEMDQTGRSRLMGLSTDGEKSYIIRKDDIFSMLFHFEYGYNNIGSVGNYIYYTSTNYSIDCHRLHRYDISTRKDTPLYAFGMWDKFDYLADENGVYILVKILVKENEKYTEKYSVKYCAASCSACEDLFDFQCDGPFYLTSEKLYYINQNTLYSIDLRTGEYIPETILEINAGAEISEFSVYNGAVYINTGSSILCYNDIAKDFEALLEISHTGEIITFWIADNRIVYECKDTVTGQYSLSVYNIDSGIDSLILSKEKALYFDVYEDNILAAYIVRTDGKKWDKFFEIYDLNGKFISNIDIDMGY